MEEDHETPTFEGELRSLLNRFSKENDSGTPDFVLAEYMSNCLTAFNVAIEGRSQFRGESFELNTLMSTGSLEKYIAEEVEDEQSSSTP